MICSGMIPMKTVYRLYGRLLFLFSIPRPEGRVPEKGEQRMMRKVTVVSLTGRTLTLTHFPSRTFLFSGGGREKEKGVSYLTPILYKVETGGGFSVFRR